MAEIIIAIGIAIAMLIYMAFKLDPKHFLLQLMIMFFVVFFLVILSKSALDVEDYCEFVPVNSTYNETSMQTTYEYDHLCVENENTTANTLHQGVLYFAWIFVIYVFIYFILEVMKYKQQIIDYCYRLVNKKK